jgi:protein-disulfide isomerase
LIRSSLYQRSALALALAFLSASPFATSLRAQTDVPAAPAATQPGPEAAAGPEFPKLEPSDFTADSPTKDQINAFLQASWGYDTTRVFQIQAIAKTAVPGISNVVILAGEKGNKQIASLQFFMLPDGKHIITGGQILPFSDHPFADNRAAILLRANGPSEGSASKNLEIVEFADFQCPHCKEAQGTIEKILADYPNAHFVYQSYPLVRIHSQAFRSAAYGACVAKLGGDKAFFTYANAVYDGQAGLATDEGATLTLNSAVSKAGQDPDKVEACSKSPETKAAIDADIKLAEDLQINQTPTLAVNGRIIPLGGIDYKLLKQVIDYHIAHDGSAK